jgi:hypothetical protein
MYLWNKKAGPSPRGNCQPSGIIMKGKTTYKFTSFQKALFNGLSSRKALRYLILVEQDLEQNPLSHEGTLLSKISRKGI